MSRLLLTFLPSADTGCTLCEMAPSPRLLCKQSTGGSPSQWVGEGTHWDLRTVTGLWVGQHAHGAGKGPGMQARGSLWWWKVADVATDFLVLAWTEAQTHHSPLQAAVSELIHDNELRKRKPHSPGLYCTMVLQAVQVSYYMIANSRKKVWILSFTH